jgi:hypothetical protein
MARRRGSSPLEGILDSSKALLRVPFRVAGPGCPMAIRATALFHRGASKYPRRSGLTVSCRPGNPARSTTEDRRLAGDLLLGLTPQDA